MNTDYRKVFMALIASAIIAVPTAIVFANYSQEADAAASQQNRLQLDIKKKSSQLDNFKVQTKQMQDKLKKQADEAEKLKQQNQQLEKQLQAKRDRQASDRQVAAATPKAAVSASGATVKVASCETYRPLVEKYFGSGASGAMIVMQHESGCNPQAVSSTNDYGLFQLHNMPIFEPEANIRAAAAKYTSPRRGTRPNFSAWYAVCTPSLIPKYAGIWCS